MEYWYETYFRKQLTELLTKYGPVYEIEFNGFQAPTGLDWAGIIRLAHRAAPALAAAPDDGRGRRPGHRRRPRRSRHRRARRLLGQDRPVTAVCRPARL